MNLDTRQILTASKSLIEENAEEKHIEFYKTYKEDNKLPWPRPFDYFFGKLIMSPNKKNFLSAGWNWGSYDAYNIFEVDHFLNSNRIAYKNIYGWEHNNRAVCWINDSTVAITCNPFEEDYEGSNQESPHEIHLYKVDGEESKIERKIAVTGLDIVLSEMHFCQDLSSFILFSDKIGLALISLDGEILFHDAKLIPDSYNSDLNLFLKTNDKSVTIYQLQK
jgi:hypothetical protein